MTKDDTIKLAREAWLTDYGAQQLRQGLEVDVDAERLQAFAELIISHKLDEMASKVEQDFKGAFGADTCASWAAWIKEQK